MDLEAAQGNGVQSHVALDMHGTDEVVLHGSGSEW